MKRNWMSNDHIIVFDGEIAWGSVAKACEFWTENLEVKKDWMIQGRDFASLLLCLLYDTNTGQTGQLDLQNFGTP